MGSAVWLDRSPYRWPFKPTLAQSRLNRQHPLAKGLIGCWLMNENAGGTFRNLGSAPGVDGSFGTNPPTWSLGKFGPALKFLSGSSQYATIPSSSAFDSTSLTVAAWFNTSTASGAIDILRRDDNGANRRWLFRLNTGKLQVTLIFGGNPSVTSAASVADGFWHLGAFTITPSGSSTIATLFIDGVSAGTATATALMSSATSIINVGSFINSSEFFNGWIDVPMIWNRALSANEFANLYRDPFAMILPPTTRRYFPVSSSATLFRRTVNRRSGSRSPVAA